MARMLVTLDTSHLEMSPLNDDTAGTSRLSNTKLMSVTAETSHNRIGSCGPLEQSVVRFRHSVMATWRSTLNCGGHPAVVYYRGHTVGVRVRVRVTIMIGVRAMLRNRGRARVRSR